MAISYPIQRTCPFHPPRALDQLRNEGEPSRVTLWSGQEVWLVTRFDEARIVLTDRRFSSSPKHAGFPLISKSFLALARQTIPGLPQLDAPEHTKIRRILAPYFGKVAIERIRAPLEVTVNEKIDHLLRLPTPIDLISEFAAPISSAGIAILLGLPVEDREFFALRTAVRFDRRSSASDTSLAQKDLESYVSLLIDRRRAFPEQDLMSELVAKYLVSGIISKSDLEVIGATLIQAGYATMANAIPLCILSLLQDPDQKRKFLSKVISARPAIDELFRFHTVGDIGLPRVALEDVRIGSVVVRAGEGIIVSLPAANRDPEQFSEPNRLNLSRNEGIHLTFGVGPHHCIGDDLARMQMEIVIRAVFSRIPTLKLTVPLENIQVATEFSLHGIRKLPVAW
jgi:cytochrome P450